MADITLTVVEEQPIGLKYIEAAIKPEQVKSVTPSYEAQTVLPDDGMTLGRVNVAAIPDPTEELNITENDDYNVARIGTVHVNVPQGVFPTGTKEITANGTGIDVEQYAAVDVAVPQGVFPSGTKEITENGTGIDVTNYAAVDVAVPGIVPSGTKQISVTQNGTTTHDVTEYASAEIVTNVPGLKNGEIVSLVHEVIEVGANSIENAGQLKSYLDAACQYSHETINAIMSIRKKTTYQYYEYLGKSQGAGSTSSYRYRNEEINTFPYGSSGYSAYCPEGTIIDVYFVVVSL